MSSHREMQPRTAVYTGLDELAVREHMMNAVGDPERGPRLLVDAPGLAVVLTADEADQLARRLVRDAAEARLVFEAATAVVSLAPEDVPSDEDAERFAARVAAYTGP